MARISEPAISEGDRQRRNQYFRDFVPGVLGYAVAIALMVAIVGDDPSFGVRLLTLMPLIPSLWSLRAIVRMIGRADEMVRAVHFEAMTLGFGAAMVTAVGVGLVGLPGEPGLFNRLAPWFIFSIGMATWGICVGVRMAKMS